MNKIIIENRIKSFRIFYGSVPRKFRLDKRDKIKEFVDSLRNELFLLKKNFNKETLKKVEEFKKKYFMINEKTNMIEFDFFNDEIIHQKITNFTFEKDLKKESAAHDIEVMEKILDCYQTKCSLNIDYSDMKFSKTEVKKQMDKILKEFENNFNLLRENIENNEKSINDGLLFIEELKVLLELSSKIATKTTTIIFSQVLINNIFRAFLKVFYNCDLSYLVCENKFFFTDVKETDYFKEIVEDSIKHCQNIINNIKKDWAKYQINEEDLLNLENNLNECLIKLEGGA